jgi:hypothetical protein
MCKIIGIDKLAKAYNVTVQPEDKIKLSMNYELLNPQKYKDI